MAVISIGLPVFEDGLDDDIEVFINLYWGYLHGIGIDPTNPGGGPPTGANRAMGVLRGCLKGPGAEWWDREITGKNWKIANVRKQGRANMGALRALIVPEGVGGPNAGTYVPGSASSLDSVDAVNALDTIGNTVNSL